MLVDMLVES